MLPRGSSRPRRLPATLKDWQGLRRRRGQQAQLHRRRSRSRRRGSECRGSGASCTAQANGSISAHQRQSIDGIAPSGAPMPENSVPPFTARPSRAARQRAISPPESRSPTGRGRSWLAPLGRQQRAGVAVFLLEVVPALPRPGAPDAPYFLLGAQQNAAHLWRDFTASLTPSADFAARCPGNNILGDAHSRGTLDTGARSRRVPRSGAGGFASAGGGNSLDGIVSDVRERIAHVLNWPRSDAPRRRCVRR